MATRSLDQQKSEAFAERMMNMLNGACITLVTSIGHQVGLFDAMADRPPSTSRQIAEAAGLNERYVREWLGAMVTGRVVDYDPTESTYSLPREHSAWLTRAAGTDNLALQAQYIPLLAQVEAPIIDCFRNGGGVGYSAYPGLGSRGSSGSGCIGRPSFGRARFRRVFGKHQDELTPPGVSIDVGQYVRSRPGTRR